MERQSLEDFVERVSGDAHLRIEDDFGDGFVRLRTSEAERRQAAQDIRSTENIVLELLRNSRDAHASSIFIALSREGVKRAVTVIDNGCGIPPSMHERVFEPRVTSKLNSNHMDTWGMHGRGMALYSISVNAQRACVIDSDKRLGCSLRVETDLRKLGEKADQSSFPTFELGEGGNVNVRGPRNILRTVCEFAIEARGTCSVYIGSPVEIASTLYAHGMATLSPIDRVFCKDAGELPLVKRLATTGDPESFAREASHIGLDLSPRSARRVLDGEIKQLDPILERVSLSGKSATRNEGMKPRGARMTVSKLKLEREESALLAEALKPAFSEIADRYYLERDVEATVRVNGDRLVITVPLVETSQ